LRKDKITKREQTTEGEHKNKHKQQIISKNKIEKVFVLKSTGFKYRIKGANSGSFKK
jgi:thiamine pyrophosphokinase